MEKMGWCFIEHQSPFLGTFSLRHDKYILLLNLQVELPATVELTAGGFYGCWNFTQVLKAVKLINERKSAKDN